MTVLARQLPLPLELNDRFNEAEFYQTGGTQRAVEMLEKPALWSHNRLIVWGESGGGKTHLLHIWATRNQAVFLSAPALRDLPGQISTPIVIDDSDMAADETALLHMLNAAAEAGHPALLAARLPPARQKIALPDLSSRLRASAIVEIAPPTDPERAELLNRLAAKRQLILPLQVQNYLLSRLPRTPAALIEAVTRLDRIALANGGKITRQLAAEFVNDIAAADQTGPELLSNGHSRSTTEVL
jgi:chromosomal replication initiation ATPase DnaA